MAVIVNSGINLLMFSWMLKKGENNREHLLEVKIFPLEKEERKSFSGEQI